jgi:multidrug resistance efflux pump
MKKFLIVLGVISIIIMLRLLIWTKADEPKADVQAEKPLRFVAAEGRVEPMPGGEIEVGSQLSAAIVEFYVNEGSMVKEGEPIAKLEGREIGAQIREAEASVAVASRKLNEVSSGSRGEEIQKIGASHEGAAAELDLARASFERHERLFEKGVIPRALLEEKERSFKVAAARLREIEEEKKLLEKGPKDETVKLHEYEVKRAEAAVEYHRRQLEKTLIKAPISGTVIRKYRQRGEIANQNEPLVAIANLNQLWINAEVDETDIGAIATGDPAEVTVDGFENQIFKGTVKEIALYVGSRRSRPNNPGKIADMKVVQVKISLDERTLLRIGMTVNVRIIPKGGTAPSISERGT